jgi:hypothetical protein
MGQIRLLAMVNSLRLKVCNPSDCGLPAFTGFVERNSDNSTSPAVPDV